MLFERLDLLDAIRAAGLTRALRHRALELGQRVVDRDRDLLGPFDLVGQAQGGEELRARVARLKPEIDRERALAGVDLAKLIRPAQVVRQDARAARRYDARYPTTTDHHQRRVRRRRQRPKPDDIAPTAASRRPNQRQL